MTQYKKPSVTDLLKLLDKPGLLSWANRKGLDGIDIRTARKESTGIGISLHYQIEQYVKNKTPFDHQEAFDKLMVGKNILSLETDIETEWFTGRYDMKLERQGEMFIIDFKKKVKKIYLEHKLQLIAYSMAEPCDKFAIVSIPDFVATVITIADRRPYEKILKSLSNIYQQKQIIDATS